MSRRPGPDEDEIHRYEVTAAMNSVIRACQDIVWERSHRAVWIPSDVPGRQPSPLALIQSAKRDVLDRLQRVIDAAQVVLREVQRERQQSNEGE
jgi:hypothetical protein